MMNVVRYGHPFAHRGPLSPARSDVPHLPAHKPIPTEGDTSAKPLIFRLIPPNNRTTRAWTAIAWPTNIQSRTPDGKFGPANQIAGWGDCWFLAPLAAMANDPDGEKILAESIKKVNDGYDVTFRGLPNKNVFISEAELQECLEIEGGDADTRLIELAADKLFKESGNFKSLYIAIFMREGGTQNLAEQCLQDLYRRGLIQDPMTFNPMQGGAPPRLAFFLFTNMSQVSIRAASGNIIPRDDVMRFLNQYITNDRNGASVVITGENSLDDDDDSKKTVIDWDAIRTEITSNGTVDEQQRAFLNALDRWLATRSSDDLQALMSAAGNLNLEHIDPVKFVKALARNLINMNQEHINLLRSGVQEVLAGGPGYIGFPEGHSGTIEGINEATNTFTYSEPNFSTLVHTGELSRLIEAIRSGNVYLIALPTIERDEAESSHAGKQRGRHLRQIHHQVVGDGKIDPAESGPLANLMEMDDGAFRQVYDSDKNGVIEGGELKAVQLRVDRWVEHLNLTPIW